MKVVVSADGTDEVEAAVAWCVQHLQPADEVVAVLGVSQIGEFVVGVPPFDVVGNEQDLVAEVVRATCAPLEAARLRCRAVVAHHGQARAVAEVAAAERAELIVVGKRPHGAVADAILGDVAAHLVHHPPCAVVVVPTTTPATESVLASA